ncbi:MAG: hypothetical protein V4436_03020 [Patescibacteria group bacterium]
MTTRDYYTLATGENITNVTKSPDPNATQYWKLYDPVHDKVGNFFRKPTPAELSAATHYPVSPTAGTPAAPVVVATPVTAPPAAAPTAPAAAPVAPAAVAQPAPAPQPAPQPIPVNPAVAAAQANANQPQPKKGNGRVIIGGAVTLVLLMLGIGVGLYYYAVGNNGDTNVADVPTVADNPTPAAAPAAPAKVAETPAVTEEQAPVADVPAKVEVDPDTPATIDDILNPETEVNINGPTLPYPTAIDDNFVFVPDAAPVDVADNLVAERTAFIQFCSESGGTPYTADEWNPRNEKPHLEPGDVHCQY